jgi:predicted AAA+ superfamily ATPase
MIEYRGMSKTCRQVVGIRLRCRELPRQHSVRANAYVRRRLTALCQFAKRLATQLTVWSATRTSDGASNALGSYLCAHPVAGQSWEGFVIEQLAAAMGERGALWFYRTAAGAEIDLLVERPGGGLWAFEIKRASAPTIEKGFHIACDDLKPARRFVIHGGDKRFPMAQGVEALSLIDAMREISENAESA